jgi:hypothetical protein
MELNPRRAHRGAALRVRMEIDIEPSCEQSLVSRVANTLGRRLQWGSQHLIMVLPVTRKLMVLTG